MIGGAPVGASLLVRVVPRAGATKIAGIRDGRLLLRLAAAPVDGEANQELLAFLSRCFRVPVRSLSVAAGERGRNKRIVLSGMTAEEAGRRLADLLPPTSS